MSVCNQVIQKELCGLFHQRVGAAREKLTIASEVVMLPEVQAQPGAAHRPNAGTHTVDRHGVSPNVRVVMNHKAARAIESPGHVPAILTRSFDQIEERLVQL